MPSTVLINNRAVPVHSSTSTHRQQRHRSLASVRQFHRRILAGYAPSRLHQLPLDKHIIVASSPSTSRFKGKVFLKDESNRYGLPAFKVLGAAYASYVTLCELYHLNSSKTSLQDLRTSVQGRKVKLVAATDGNHGRAVAFFAHIVGVEASIFIPSGVSETAERAISEQCKQVVVVRLQHDYDTCVKQAMHYASETTDQEQRVLIQDTAWKGYTRIPQLIVDGYQTIFDELDSQLERPPTHVFCPVGVGSLAQAAVQFYAADEDLSKGMSASIIAVEPVTADCLAQSISADELQSIETGETVMAGLNCGTPSHTAWPYLRAGISGVVTIKDQQALDAMRWLNQLDSRAIVAGPCGAAPLAALQVLLNDSSKAQQLGLLDDDQVSVVLLMTEGNVSAL